MAEASARRTEDSNGRGTRNARGCQPTASPAKTVNPQKGNSVFAKTKKSLDLVQILEMGGMHQTYPFTASSCACLLSLSISLGRRSISRACRVFVSARVFDCVMLIMPCQIRNKRLSASFVLPARLQSTAFQFSCYGCHSGLFLCLALPLTHKFCMSNLAQPLLDKGPNGPLVSTLAFPLPGSCLTSALPFYFSFCSYRNWFAAIISARRRPELPLSECPCSFWASSGPRPTLLVPILWYR